MMGARITGVLYNSGVQRKEDRYVPLSRKLNLWEVVFSIMVFLVNCHVFFATWTAGTIFLVDFDLFLADTSTISTVRQRCREGRVSRFVTFPSNARRWLGEVGFSFYSNTSSLGGVFVPVRRWEDAEGDRDSGVKIQIAWSRGSPVSNALRTLRAIERKTRRDSEMDGLLVTRLYLLSTGFHVWVSDGLNDLIDRWNGQSCGGW